jgi:hypothetical protein
MSDALTFAERHGHYRTHPVPRRGSGARMAAQSAGQAHQLAGGRVLAILADWGTACYLTNYRISRCPPIGSW